MSKELSGPFANPIHTIRERREVRDGLRVSRAGQWSSRYAVYCVTYWIQVKVKWTRVDETDDPGSTGDCIAKPGSISFKQKQQNNQKQTQKTLPVTRYKLIKWSTNELDLINNKQRIIKYERLYNIWVANWNM